MARLALTSFFAIIVFCSSGESWYQGSVVLANDRVVVGQIARPSPEIIVVKTNDELMVYPAHQVKSYRYFDEGENINRIFISHHVSVGGIPVYQFFESVVNGRINVWRKQKIFEEKITENRDFHYFIYCDGELVSLNKFRGNFYKKMIHEAGSGFEYSAFNPNRSDDVIRMILLFNQICPAVSIAAS